MDHAPTLSDKQQTSLISTLSDVECEIDYEDIIPAFISDRVAKEILKAFSKTHPDSFVEKK